ncbi:hypothetical protein V8C35DRAFT_162317 [Trichoderma chlorosporum]
MYSRCREKRLCARTLCLCASEYGVWLFCCAAVTVQVSSLFLLLPTCEYRYDFACVELQALPPSCTSYAVYITRFVYEQWAHLWLSRGGSLYITFPRVALDFSIYPRPQTLFFPLPVCNKRPGSFDNLITQGPVLSTTLFHGSHTSRRVPPLLFIIQNLKAFPLLRLAYGLFASPSHHPALTHCITLSFPPRLAEIKRTTHPISVVFGASIRSSLPSSASSIQFFQLLPLLHRLGQNPALLPSTSITLRQCHSFAPVLLATQSVLPLPLLEWGVWRIGVPTRESAL